MRPEDFLRETESQLQKMIGIKRKYVAVGILANDATSRVYDNGMTAAKVGAIHEFGLGTSPERSFLRMPQELKALPLKDYINKQLENVLAGDTVQKGLGKIGVYAVNLSVDAFKTEGFGRWPRLSPLTVELKRSGGAESIQDVANASKASKSAFFEPERPGENQILTDTGTLKNSISYEVR